MFNDGIRNGIKFNFELFQPKQFSVWVCQTCNLSIYQIRKCDTDLIIFIEY